MDEKGIERCRELFTELLQKTQYGAVVKEVCIGAAEAGASCLAEVDRLRSALTKIANAWPCSDAYHMQVVAREALGIVTQPARIDN